MKKLIFILMVWGCDFAPTEHTHEHEHNTTHEHDDIYGCTDSTACNYNSNATIHDGTCDYGFQYNLQFTVDEFVNTATTFIINLWVTNVGDTTITSSLGFSMELYANSNIDSKIFQYGIGGTTFTPLVPFTPKLIVFEINNDYPTDFNLADFNISVIPWP